MGVAVEQPTVTTVENVKPGWEEWAVPRTPTPALSVTVLNYNYGHYLRECLDSVLSQTFEDFEVILIDDRSTDGSLEVIRPYLKDPRVRVVAHEANRGFASSLIEGTEAHSRGEFLTVISADDRALDALAFARQVTMLRENEQMSFCFTGRVRMYTSGDLLPDAAVFADDTVIPSEDALELLIADTSVQVLHSGTIFRSSLYDTSGKYSRTIKYALDFDLWPRLSLEGPVGFCPGGLYGYRVHGDQMSHAPGTSDVILEEVLGAIDRVCLAAAERGIGDASLKTRAVRENLFAEALDDAWSGRRRLALKRCGLAIRRRPRHALTSPALAIIAARLVLGDRGYSALHKIARGGGGPATAPHGTAAAFEARRHARGIVPLGGPSDVALHTRH